MPDQRGEVPDDLDTCPQRNGEILRAESEVGAVGNRYEIEHSVNPMATVYQRLVHQFRWPMSLLGRS